MSSKRRIAAAVRTWPERHWCAYCGVRMDFNRMVRLTEKRTTAGGWSSRFVDRSDGWDHVDPVAGGGTGDVDNLLPACRTCNSRKGAMPLVVFLALRQRAGKQTKREWRAALAEAGRTGESTSPDVE